MTILERSCIARSWPPNQHILDLQLPETQSTRPPGHATRCGSQPRASCHAGRKSDHRVFFACVNSYQALGSGPCTLAPEEDRHARGCNLHLLQSSIASRRAAVPKGPVLNSSLDAADEVTMARTSGLPGRRSRHQHGARLRTMTSTTSIIDIASFGA